MVGEDGEDNIPHREWLVVFDRVLNEVKANMKRQGREDEFIGARVSESYVMSHIKHIQLTYRSYILPFDSLHQRSSNGILKIVLH
jgi:hypothetical protein